MKTVLYQNHLHSYPTFMRLLSKSGTFHFNFKRFLSILFESIKIVYHTRIMNIERLQIEIKKIKRYE